MTHFSNNAVLFAGGLDPCAQAGLLRDVDIANFCGVSHRVFVTALTAQNDKLYSATLIPDHAFLQSSWQVIAPQDVAVIKIGMLGSSKVVNFFIQQFQALRKNEKFPAVIWDPVFVSSSGGKLLDDEGLRLMRDIKWWRHVDFVTPNAIEAAFFLEQKFNPENRVEDLAQALFERYQKPFLVKGGHTKLSSRDAFFDGRDLVILENQKWEGERRGTGCALASAFACEFAVGQKTWLESCQNAKKIIKDYFNRPMS